MPHASQLNAYQHQIETHLAEYMDELWPYGQLAESMTYSVLGGGKRIRPVLTLAACALCGGNPETALTLGCALELVHTYSLIHDDLPCMDDDDLRRGRPTNHRIYGQATAVLAGDALLTNAFTWITQDECLSAQQRLDAVQVLSEAAGASGMVAGQILDMQDPSTIRTTHQLENIQALKTGKLMVAAVQLGAIVAGASPAQRDALTRYAEQLGLAFQVQDDILDCTGTQSELGKPIGSDKDNGKVTFASLLGLTEAQNLVNRLSQGAKDALAPFAQHDFLCWLVDVLAQRRT